MSIEFKCSDCGTTLKVADTFAGKKCKCPKCSVVNTVPDGDEEGVTEEPKPKKSASASVATKPKKKVAEEPDEPEGEEEAPKKGKKKKAKKGGSKAMLLVGGGLALVGFMMFTCVCGGFATLYFGFPEYLPAFLGGTPSELRYMPTGTTTLTFNRVDQERNSKYSKDVEAAMPASLKGLTGVDGMEKTYGIAGSNIDHTLEGGSGAERVIVVTAKASVKSVDVLSKIKDSNKQEYEEEKAGSYVVQKSKNPGGMAFCVLGGKEGKTVVYSHDAKTLKAVLERDKMPEFPTAMQSALKKASFSKTSVHISAGGDAGTMLGGTGGGKAVKPEFTVMERDLGSDERIRIYASFKDSADAAEAKKTADEQVLKQKAEYEKKGLAGEVTTSVSVSGNVLTADIRMTSKVAIENFKGIR